MHSKNIEIEKLRAVAIIFVVLWHYSDILFDVVGVNRAYYATWTGVDLFFCISGYVITRSLIPSLSGSNLGKYLGNFYIKRVSRILPSALLCIGLALSLAFATRRFVGSEFFADTKRDALPALLNYANIAFYEKMRNHGGTLLGIFWSLSLEEQFYLVIPVFLWVFRRRFRLLVSVLLPFALWQSAQQRDSWHSLLWAVRTDGLIYGVLISLAEWRIPLLFERARRVADRLRLSIRVLVVPCLLLGLGVVASAVGAKFTQRSTGWAAIIGATLVFLATLDRKLVVPGTVATRALNWIGGRSYSLYLFHNVVLVMAKALNVKTFHVAMNAGNPFYYLFVFVTLGALCLWSEVNYRIVESPIRKLGRRLADKYF